MKKIREVLKILFSNFNTLILFQLMYNFFSFSIYSLLSKLLNFSLNSAGLNYFTNENIIKLFQNPLSILSIILLILVSGLYFYIQYAALTIYFDSKDKNIKLLPFLKQILLKFKRILKLANFPIIFIILLISIVQYLLYSPAIFKLVIPEFIVSFIFENKILLTGFILMFVLLFLLFIFFAPTLYYFFIKEKTLKESLIECKTISSHQFIKKTLKIIFYSLIFWLLFYLVYLLIFLFLAFIFRFIIQDTTYFWFIFKRIQSIYYLLNPILLISLNIFLIYTIFIPKEPNLEIEQKKKKNPFITTIKIVIVSLLLVAFVGFSDPKIYNNIDYSQIKIISHRAGGLFAPENTIAGIQEAINNGSDYAEIDVQVTKDGVLVLSHDPSLKRTAKLDKEISDLTYDELSNIDVGFFYNPIYKNEKIPTLEEVLKFSKGKIKLVVELKKSNNDKELVKKTIDLIEHNNMEQECVIASLQFDIIKEAKQINKNIETAYITAIAYGDLLSIKDYVDIYAFEPSYLDEQIIQDLKYMHKKVFVWTINNDRNIREVLSLPIDGIITDNPYLVQYIMESYSNDPISQLLLDI